MKIKKLVVENFRNHKNTDLVLDKVNFFVGHNNAGKTSLLAAIEWGLTGRCMWTDKAGRGAAELVRRGEKQAVVALEVENIGSIVRTMPPHSLRVGSRIGNEAQGGILNSLRTDEEHLKLALNTSAFLSMSPAEQRAFLFGAFGLSFTAERVAEKLEGWLQKNGHPVEPAKALAARAKGYYPANITGGPEVLEVMEKKARDLRKELKKDKQRAEAALTEMAEGMSAKPQADQVEALKERLSALRKQRETLMQKAGDPNLPARRESLLNRIQVLEEKIKTA